MKHTRVRHDRRKTITIMPFQNNPPLSDRRVQSAGCRMKNSDGRGRYLAALCTLHSALCHRLLFALVCYAAILLAAFNASHSTGEFLVLGLGPALLLDRYLFRLLPWTYPLRWTKELLLRAAYVGLGGVGYSLARAGMIRAEEAFSLGLALSLAAFLFECSISLGARGGRRVAHLWRAKAVRSPRSVVRSQNGKHCGLRTTDHGLGITLPPQHRSRWTPLHHLLFFCPAVVLALPLFALHMPRTIPTDTPAGLHLPFEEVHFETRDGLELGGWLIPHRQARGTIIFCHGHGQNRGQVLGCLPILHALRLNVLAFDFRGHGDSPGHTETFGQREVYDLVAADAYVRQQFGQQPIFLMGVSYGAAVALQALPLLPPVQAVWIESCFSRFNTVVNSTFSWLPALLRCPVERAYLLMAWLDCGFSESAITPIRSLAKLAVPICFCHGMKDELVPFADGQSLYRAYAGPKWHYWVKNAGHDNVQARAPAEYRRRLSRFFEERLDQ
jgi:pimeloyl-ACP methyl ester carboxylesterase